MQPNIHGLKIKISNTPKTLISTFSWDICARLTAYSNKGKAQYWRIQKTYDAASKEMFVFPIKISSEVSISSNFSSSELLETCSIHHYPGSRRPMQNSHSTNFYNIGNFYQINLQFSQKRKTCVGRCIDYSIVSGSEGFRTQMMPIAQTAM